MADEIALSRIHHELIRGLIESGTCPKNSELGQRFALGTVQIEELLRGLAEIHGLVLHPHVCEPWIVHPFSLTPTIHWIKGQQGNWWAPCVWCALGIAALIRGEAQIHTRIGGEAEPLTLQVIDGRPVGFDDICIHFAIPPARAWQNVHQHCSMVLPFRSRQDIHDWCKRHQFPYGEAVPLHQVARLAQLWYGTYADVNWHRWTVTEAQDIFREAGLVSSFWDLGEEKGKF